MPKICLPKLHHEVCYEWVLKKKHSWSMHHNKGGCDNCGGGPVYATGQGVAASAQGAGAPSAQVYGAGQHAFLPARSATAIASVPAEMTPATPGGEEVPPAPAVKETSANGPQGGLLLPTPSGY
jgi:hypothetical protein